MKNRRLVLALTSLVLSCANNGVAQTAAKPLPPEGPLLVSAPDPSAWTITLSYPQDRVKGGVKGFTETRTRTITTTKTGKIIHEESVGAQGTKYDSWHVGRNVYDKWTGAPSWSQEPANTATRAEFKDLDWVSKNDYVGKLDYAGHRCLVFVEGAPADLNVESSTFEMDQLDNFHNVSFIDAKSRLPVETRTFGTYSSYSFTDGPAEKLTLPADLVTQLKKDQEILSRLSGHFAP